jgi:hypothetical protein
MIHDIVKAIRAGYREARAVYRRAKWLRKHRDSINFPF